MADRMVATASRARITQARCKQRLIIFLLINFKVRLFTNKPPCGPKRGHGTPQPIRNGDSDRQSCGVAWNGSLPAAPAVGWCRRPILLRDLDFSWRRAMVEVWIRRTLKDCMRGGS